MNLSQSPHGNDLKVVGIIPARYNSTRFPGKPLVPLLGKPMVIWTLDAASKALGRDNTFVATDDSAIADCAKEHGYNFIMTSKNVPTGTDRLYEVSQKLDADIYINIQGDEPMVDPENIIKVVDAKIAHPGNVINAMCSMGPEENPADTNIPKVIVNGSDMLIYMSRSVIPGSKSENHGSHLFAKQVCIYAFNKGELNAFGEYGGKGAIEQVEDIEIIRFLEMGVPVRMVKLQSTSYAIDIPEDVATVENLLRKR